MDSPVYLTRVLTPKCFSMAKLQSREGAESPAHSSQGLYSQRTELINKLQEEKIQKYEVSELNFWENKKSNYSSKSLIQEAQDLLARRINHQNYIEQTITNRKKPQIKYKKNNFNSVKVHNDDARLQKKIELDQIKEKSRFRQLYEEDLNQLYEKFKSKLDKCNQDRESLRLELSDLRQELKENSEDLEKHKKLLQSLEKNKRKFIKNAEAAKFFSSRMSMRDDIFKKEANLMQTSEEISLELSKLLKLIENLDQECVTIRKEIKLIQDAQITHYKSLLEEGKDTRSKGISWIVQKLWSLGQEVVKNSFPAFLDEKSIEVVMTLSNKNKELEDLIEKISANFISKRSLGRTTQDRWNGVHLRLASLSKAIRIKKPEGVTYTDSKKTKSWENCSPEPNEFKSFTTVNLVATEKTIENLRTDIKSIIDQEIQRLFKECHLNNYENKKNVDLRTLISIFVGIDNIDKYSSTVIKLKRDLSEKLNSTKTFKFS